MIDKSPHEQRRIVLLFAGLGDAAIGLALICIGLRITPIFADYPARIFFIIGGIMFTIGTLVAIFNFSPHDEIE